MQSIGSPQIFYNENSMESFSELKLSLFNWIKSCSYGNSFIFDLFGGQTRTKFECQTCTSVWFQFETQRVSKLDLPIKINKFNLIHLLLQLCGKKENLNHLLQIYGKKELNKDHICKYCESRGCIKDEKYSILPKILQIGIVLFNIALNKSTFSAKGARKIRSLVSFPEEFEFPRELLSESFAKGKVVYDLVSVVYHVGNTLYEGHYYAACKYGEKWSIKNDAKKVHLVDRPAAEDAYILFYRKRE